MFLFIFGISGLVDSVLELENHKIAMEVAVLVIGS